MLLFVFLGFLLKLSNIRLGIKPLFRQKPFLKRSKKKIKACRLSDEFLQALSLFRFSAKKSFEVCSFVAYSDVPQNKQIKHLRRRPVEQGSLLVNLILTFPIIFPSRTLFDK